MPPVREWGLTKGALGSAQTRPLLQGAGNELPGGQVVGRLAPRGMNAPVPRLAPSASMTSPGMQSRSTFVAARRWGHAPSGFILVGFPGQQPDVAHSPHVSADGRDRSLGSAGSDGLDNALVLLQRTFRTTRLAE